MRSSPSARFWKRVDRSGGPQACWPWRGGRNKEGYGYFWLNGRGVGAHTFAFSEIEEIGANEIVGHACDNPPCCNPEHLFATTHKGNAEDRDAKGRRTPPRGEASDVAVLTDEIVLAARCMHEKGRTFTSLAAMFGVKTATLRRAVRGDTWKHLH